MRELMNVVDDSKTYQINYHLEDEESETKGSYNKRWSALTNLIKQHIDVSKHDETSSWIVKSKIQKAADLLIMLVPPLDEELDSLHIVEVIPSNRAKLN